ncbi:hypothetical protein EVAR_11071_1 [Eumeta japonica]|uniref:Uncharacterized protein n=1 Tax=Eumeta variegata TaxID=151549 RepID=A0A4C1U476_EUMVA|nr:hypothetical protein EVAR_11071_1 [Eumeta japonica]
MLKKERSRWARACGRVLANASSLRNPRRSDSGLAAFSGTTAAVLRARPRRPRYEVTCNRPQAALINRMWTKCDIALAVHTIITLNSSCGCDNCLQLREAIRYPRLRESVKRVIDRRGEGYADVCPVGTSARASSLH